MAWAKGAAAAPHPSPPSSPPPPWSPPVVAPDPADAQSWQSQPPAGLASPYLPSAWQHVSADPRSSSSHSLLPSLHGDDDGRRTLLIIYIHGFMGDNTSFQSFPAHVHNYLQNALQESHVIHSKIYPRYKTYNAIDVARDNFSKWLEPHESETTDVILVGHSMGGLLAADVALMPSPSPVYGPQFKHRILGTVSLDAPLLGLHPGIIKSGIASLFRKAPDPPGKAQASADSLASSNIPGSTSTLSFSTDPASPPGYASSASGTPRPDPNYNPPFFNDVQFVDRGWLRNVAHFAKKHYSDGLLSSTYQHLVSHLEFGSCLADYTSLKSRYNKLRQLEDVDQLHASGYGGEGSGPSRVRFVNYYTVSTGIPKKLSVPERSNTHLRPELPEAQSQLSTTTTTTTMGSTEIGTPRISVEDYSDAESQHEMQILEPEPLLDHEAEPHSKTPDKSSEAKPPDYFGDPETSNTVTNEDSLNSDPTDMEKAGGLEDFSNDLPAIPDLPEQPPAPDLDKYTDKDARKQAEKEFKRIQKIYEQAVKDRDKAIKERHKLVEKRRKKAQKQAEKELKDEEKRFKDEAKRLAKEQKALAKEQEHDLVMRAEQEEQQQQVANAAQTQALHMQLADLALHDKLPDSSSGSPALSSPPLYTPTTTATATTTVATGSDSARTAAVGMVDQNGNPKKKEKLHKFCMVPPKTNGVRDTCWVQIYMEGVDEVGAHCGLFFPGPHYEKLVSEVGARIVGWVHEDLSVQSILALD